MPRGHGHVRQWVCHQLRDYFAWHDPWRELPPVRPRSSRSPPGLSLSWLGAKLRAPSVVGRG